MKKLLKTETLSKWWFYFKIYVLNPFSSWHIMEYKYSKVYDDFVNQLLEANDWKFILDDHSGFTVKLGLLNESTDKVVYYTFWIGNYPYCYFNLYKRALSNPLTGLDRLRPSKYTIYRVHKAIIKQRRQEGWFKKYLNNYIICTE